MPQSIDAAFDAWLQKWPPKHPRHSRLPAAVPDPTAIRHIAEVIFFASLATEEKEPTRVSVAWHSDGAKGLRNITDREHASLASSVRPWDVLRIVPLSFDVAGVAKAAPLVEFGTSLLVVGRSEGSYFIDGVARLRPHTFGGSVLVLRAEAPGVITIEAGGIEIFRFERGETVTPPPDPFEDFSALEHHAQAMLPAPTSRGVFGRSPIDVLRNLAAVMTRTRHGGLLLFLPTEPTPAELKRVKLPVHAEDGEVLLRAFISVNNLAGDVEDDAFYRDNPDSQNSARLAAALADLGRWTEVIGRLTAVDNAVLIGPGFRIVGAQYEVPSDSSPDVYEALNPQGDAGPKYVKRHGSRHRAAACFVDAGEGRIAILSSADGPLRCFMKVNGNVVMWHIRLPRGAVDVGGRV
jgi:hypothetical protein